jgi:hypothetical protein
MKLRKKRKYIFVYGIVIIEIIVIIEMWWRLNILLIWFSLVDTMVIFAIKKRGGQLSNDKGCVVMITLLPNMRDLVCVHP